MSVTVEDFTLAHAAATREWLADGTLRSQIDSLGPQPGAQANEQYWAARLADDRHRVFALVAHGEHIGNCGLIVDSERRKAELWLYVRAGSQGKGAGREAVEQVLSVAFGSIGLHRVYVRVLVTNERGLAFWRRCGFVQEGRLRADTWHDGDPVDAAVLSILAPEWKTR